MRTWLAGALVGISLVGGGSAKADHLGFGVHAHWGACAHPHCVTDCGWYRPGVGFGSGVFLSPWGGYYASSYSNVGYSSWGLGPAYWPGSVAYQTVVVPSPAVVVVSRNAAPRFNAPPPPRLLPAPPVPNIADILQQHAERREGIPAAEDDSNVIRPVSGSSRVGKERSKQFQAEGDRWLREGQFVKAYLRYLEAQREAEDRGEVYFRQAFTLVAMGRYSHAVMKLKRGLQVDPNWPRSGESLVAIYGANNVTEKSEYLKRVTDWTDQDVRDADRLFLMGVLLFCDGDSRASDFFRAAWKLTGRGEHLQAFLRLPESPPKESVSLSRRGVPNEPPPPPRDDPAEPPGVPPRPREDELVPAKEPPETPAVRGPRLIMPDVPVPPEPK